MSVIIPDLRRAEPDESAIRAGIVPSAITWAQLGSLANWLSSQGACIIAGHAVTTAMDQKAHTFRYRTKPRAHAIARLWCLLPRVVGLVSTGAQVIVRAPASTGTAVTYAIGTSRFQTPIYYLELLTARSAVEQELTFDATMVGTGSVYFDCVRCFEVPRGALVLDAVDYGVDLASLRNRSRIYDGAAGKSVAAVQRALEASDPRRVGIFHFAVPDSYALKRTIADSQNIFALAVPVLVPKLASSGTTEQIYWSVYAKTAVGGAGSVEMTTSHSGVSDTMSVSATAYAWTTKRAVSVDKEDYDVEDGRRSSTWDEMMFSFKGDGTHQLSLLGISVWSEAT